MNIPQVDFTVEVIYINAYFREVGTGKIVWWQPPEIEVPHYIPVFQRPITY